MFGVYLESFLDHVTGHQQSVDMTTPAFISENPEFGLPGTYGRRRDPGGQRPRDTGHHATSGEVDNDDDAEHSESRDTASGSGYCSRFRLHSISLRMWSSICLSPTGSQCAHTSASLISSMPEIIAIPGDAVHTGLTFHSHLIFYQMRIRSTLTSASTRVGDLISAVE